jgi:hypothetical protein
VHRLLLAGMGSSSRMVSASTTPSGTRCLQSLMALGMALCTETVPLTSMSKSLLAFFPSFCMATTANFAGVISQSTLSFAVLAAPYKVIICFLVCLRTNCQISNSATCTLLALWSQQGLSHYGCKLCRQQKYALC